MENPSEKKSARLLQVEALLLSHPEGMTQAEIARRLGVNRSTINRYLPDLPKHICISPDGLWQIDRSAYLVNVRFNLHEALSVHLAARLLATRLDRQNPHAAAALRKLGVALETLAPTISRHLGQAADLMDTDAKRHDVRYIEVLERLTLAWAEGRKVKVWHRQEVGEEVRVYTFSPYFLEPYAVGQTTHVMGWREPPGAMRTFRVDRIERVEPTGEPYTIPADFDPRELLSDAWGIWYTGQEPREVHLRFHPRVATRVRETQWHRSEQLEEQSDGWLNWRARVAEPREMLPWIRGWGGDVEVVAPESLRNLMKRETLRMVQLYHPQANVIYPKSFSLWSKAEQTQDPDTHPLIYHLLDVGQTALALWEHCLSPQTRQTFSRALNFDEQTTGRLLAFWAALHDLGKAAPGFQRKYRPALPGLTQAGFTFPEEAPNPAPHGILTAWTVEPLLVQETGMDRPDAHRVAVALGGHHGAWPTGAQLLPSNLKQADRGDAAWDAARKELFLALKEVYALPEAPRLPPDPLEANALLALFSGMVTVADWVGSVAELFPFTSDYHAPFDYAKQAAAKAAHALETLGWAGWRADGIPSAFDRLFPNITTPNPIQQMTFDAALGSPLPALVILEAPTGIGKTEAALYLAEHWLHSQQGSGMYIAMPSQATSNQMYQRFVQFLESRYPAQTVNAHLVHGAALLAEEPPHPSGIAMDERSPESGVKAETWFLPRKRTLLAPFGVGTVDQALLSVLQTRHFFVRLFGLGQKVVIFDEVHAYDTYMSTLFERLLSWLRSIGTSVILLSATLPESTRESFVRAWQGEETAPPPGCPYPRLTVAGGEMAQVQPLPAPPSRSLALDWVDAAPEQIADHLAEQLAEGGCAAVICNRVRRAQEVYQVLLDRKIVEPEQLILFHARFPLQWRMEMEQQVLGRFSKEAAQAPGGRALSQRPHKAVVVATQVIEQSLDLDFDYLVSDLAPVDLLLQRAGRLHRHRQNDAGRPAPLRAPHLAIARPRMDGQLPAFGPDARVYAEAVLLRSWLALRDRDHLSVPDQTESLIEAVYGDGLDRSGLDDDLRQVLHKAEERARQENDKRVFEAKKRLIALPEDEDLLNDRNDGLEEDGAQVHEAFRALTRLSEPGVSVVCLHQTARGLALEPDGTGAPLDLNLKPDLALSKDLLRRAVTIQRQDVCQYLLAQGNIPPAWRKASMLRDHYPVIFDETGEYHPPEAGFYLKLTRQLGLEILKEDR